MTKELELQNWANNTLALYNKIIGDLLKNKKDAYSFYNQSNLHFVKDCQLMIMGINPGDGIEYSKWKDKDKVDAEYLLQGNPCFHGKSPSEILYILKEKPIPNKKSIGWPLYNRLYQILSKANKEDILLDISKFALTNLILFGTLHENMLPKMDLQKCIDSSLELVDILKPKILLLLGAKCRETFNRTKKLEPLITGLIQYNIYNDTIVIAIPHTAYYYSAEEMEIVGKVISYALDNETINPEIIQKEFAQEIENYKKRCLSKTKSSNKKITSIDIKSIQENILNHFAKYKYHNGIRLRKKENSKYGITIAQKNILVRQAYEDKYKVKQHDSNEEKIINLLQSRDYTHDNIWLGKRPLTEFGKTETEIFENACIEIEELFKLLDEKL